MAEVNLNNEEEVIEEINFSDYAASEDVVSGIKLEKTNSQIYYLDENNNYTTEEYAVKSVIRVTDENGNLIEEVWGSKGDEGELDENTELKVLYVDEEENEVEEEVATHMIMKKFVNGEEVSSEKYPIYKDNGMQL